MKNIQIAIWGFGAMGAGMARMISKKTGVDVAAVCDLHPARIGRSAGEVLGINKWKDVIIEDSIEKALDGKDIDLCLLATDSFTRGAFPKMETILEKGINIITTAEEMAYPRAGEPELAKRLDEIAKANGVTVLGTGINPGLIMDLLVICLTGCMEEVIHIEAKRVNSLSPFGETVMEEQGVGITEEEFNDRVAHGKLAGHVGFNESINMIADAIGWKVDEFRQQMKPILTTVDRKSPHGFAPAGNLAGINMTGQGYIDGEVKIDMIHPQQIEPEMEGTHTGDYITLAGNPPVNMAITPEVDGGIGTIAMCVNMIPHVMNAKPGLKTMIDLPVPRAIMGDMRDMLE
ncbi:MAG TPA: 2,4-diaminopentanoate dehydrogenase [Clostridia bacterium]|nr:2,4-diaminopentanoate dehydrogenase [Clostridia bacterium]HRX41343.1 2,4-diaminopentanoate dehydrogenase [Clostridia bacterium]